jgi:uncharacterized protein with ParB-like and HNH nuclease domain
MHNFLANTYYIPNYQREYSWENDELLDFWTDLLDTSNDSDDIHFYGQIVVHDDEENGKKYIIDGQQRTTTSMIFLKVLQGFAEEIYKQTENDDAKYISSDIESVYLGRKNKRHLTLGETNNDYFENNIISKVDIASKAKKKSNENLRNAYVFLHDKVKGYLAESDGNDERMELFQKIYETFIHRFKVLYMEATRLEEAFVIFETLNARGRDLETADLLKNYILNQSKDIEDSIKKWNSMMGKLDKVDPTKFIRYYWNATNSFTREKALYKTISRKVKTPKDCRLMLKNLDRIAPVFHDLVNPTEVYFFNQESQSEIRDIIIALKTLKASTFYPIVLAIELKYEDCDKMLIKVLKQIENYVFRNFTICGNTANSAEIFFAEIAKKISDEIITTCDEICEEIKKGIVSDQEFINSFVIWSGSKTTKETVRYIFRKIHRYLDKNLELNINNSEVHIEHIMPEEASLWNVDPEMHDTYLWRLGNLALLSGPINSSISNKPFDQKEDGYLKSSIKPNTDIKTFLDDIQKDGSVMVWNEKSIEKRQVKLAEYAKAIWK